MTKTHVVTIHFNRQQQDWTVHYLGKCIRAETVELRVTSRTVYKPKKLNNPRAWIACRGVVRITGTHVEVYK